jgi:tetratricopeptide (TPR) repeat protein
LGLAYSELGEFDEAIIRLKRVVAAEPTHAHAWTAIGVAYQRSGKPALALDAFKAAVDANPDDGYALRNYGGGLAGAGKLEEALPLLRKAVARLPDDPQSLYGLASVLESLGGAERAAEADTLQQDIVRRFPASPAAELARESRTRRAHASLRAAVGGGLRPDVMMYIAGALDTFKEVGPQKRQQIAFEIGMLGQGGLDINDPEQKYSLKSLPGQFSGLHLLALMYTAFQQIDPTVDAGVDFSKEYAAAKAMGKG